MYNFHDFLCVDTFIIHHFSLHLSSMFSDHTIMSIRPFTKATRHPRPKNSKNQRRIRKNTTRRKRQARALERAEEKRHAYFILGDAKNDSNKQTRKGETHELSSLAPKQDTLQKIGGSKSDTKTSEDLHHARPRLLPSTVILQVLVLRATLSHYYSPIYNSETDLQQAEPTR